MVGVGRGRKVKEGDGKGNFILYIHTWYIENVFFLIKSQIFKPQCFKMKINGEILPDGSGRKEKEWGGRGSKTLIDKII